MDAIAVLGASEFEQVQWLGDRASGAVAVVAIHDTRLGPAHGGIRCRAYADLGAALADALALAQAMTWKCALAGLPAGGGKAVILDRPGLDRAAAYRLLGRHVQAMRGRFFTGPDAGTTTADLAVVAEETAFVADPGADGAGDLGEATAAGVFAALQATAARCGLPLAGLRVAVQGVGLVGSRLCARLHAVGARLLVADVAPAAVAAAVAAYGAEAVPPAAIATVDCDVFAPCALGGVLHAGNAAAVRARAVCGAANNVLADAATGRALHARGVLVAPDFVANAGALIQGLLWHQQRRRPDAQRFAAIGERVGALLDRAQATGVPPGELALQQARELVAAAPPRPYFAPA